LESDTDNSAFIAIDVSCSVTSVGDAIVL